MEHGEALLQEPAPTDDAWRVAAMAVALRGQDVAHGTNWRANSVEAFDLVLQCGDRMRSIRVRPDRHGSIALTLDGTTVNARVLGLSEGSLRYAVDGVVRTAVAVFAGASVHLALQGQTFVFAEVSPFPDADSLKDASQARAPVAGKVTQVLVAAGAVVQVGQQLVCVEAMKMEMWLCAEAAGQVLALHAKVGDQVESGALLVELELESIKKEA
jgi:geranyl-CoA carboxylase alpha subunit